MIRIDDPSDPRVAAYVSLTDAALRRRLESPTGATPNGIFIAEGALVIRRLVASTYRVRSVLVSPRRYEDLASVLQSLDAPVYVADLDLMRAIAGFNVHRGALAEADRRPLPALVDVLASASMLAVLEGINDLENMGTIFRNAAALGVDAILLCPRCCDPFSRRAVRVSMGCVLSVPFATLAPWPDGLSALHGAGFELVALTPDRSAVPIDAVTADKVALMFGAEGPGLSPAALAHAGTRARIPMRAGTDSLNVGNAAAIAFHQFAKMSR